jgi:hypothetical protein
MAFLSTEDFVLKVGTTSGAAGTVVEGVRTFNDSAARTTTNVKIFAGNALSFTAADPRTFEGTLVRDPADAGQNIIKAAYDSGDTIWAQNLEDGTNGEKWPVVVTAWNRDRNADDNVPNVSFSLQANGDVALVGTGS